MDTLLSTNMDEITNTYLKKEQMLKNQLVCISFLKNSQIDNLEYILQELEITKETLLTLLSYPVESYEYNQARFILLYIINQNKAFLKKNEKQRHINPEGLVMCDGEVHNINMEKTSLPFDSISSLLFESIPCNSSSLFQILSSFSNRMPEQELIKKIETMAETQDEIVFNLMCLPCLNPSPFITDHPSLSINIPTIIFCRRLNNLAEQLSSFLKKPVTIKIAKEFNLLAAIFKYTQDEINSGNLELEGLLANFEHLQTYDIPIISGQQSNVSNLAAEGYISSFEKAEYSTIIHPIIQAYRLGVINEADYNRSLQILGLEIPDNAELSAEQNENARKNARTFALIKTIPIKSYSGFEQSIDLSVRPGNFSKFTIIPVSENSSEELPMLPQHCCVGIDSNGRVITKKRVEFLIKPNKYVEVITEYGCVFIAKSIFETIK